MKINPLLYQRINNVESIITCNGDVIPYKNFTNTHTEKFYTFKVEEFRMIMDAPFLSKFDKPLMLFTTGFEIPQLSKIKFDIETINLLNKEGLHIFLSELLVKYKGPRTFISKSNLSKEKLDELEFSNARFEITDEEVRVCQFDSINDLIENNGLLNVNVYSPEYRAQEFFKNYPKLNLYYKDVFLDEKLAIIIKSPCASTNIRYKFLATNWRYAAHRHISTAFVATKNSKYSWYYTGSIEKLNSNLWFDINNWKTKYSNLYAKLVDGIEHLNKVAPVCLDIDVKEPVEIQGRLSDFLNLPATKDTFGVNTNVFDDVFCVIANECEYSEPTGNYSEKTLYAIRHLKPFIIVGQPYSLELLKKTGFKTFNEFWDESYDNELNHEKRFIKLLELIDSIDNLSVDDLKELYTKMKPVLDYNYNLLVKLSSTGTPIL